MNIHNIFSFQFYKFVYNTIFPLCFKSCTICGQYSSDLFEKFLKTELSEFDKKILKNKKNVELPEGFHIVYIPKQNNDLVREVHMSVKKISQDISNEFQFNTVISKYKSS